MSQRAVDFVHMWISANVHPHGVIYETRDTRSKEYAAECRKHAVAVGISPAEMSESFEDLEAAMARAVEESVDQNSGRTARRDD